MSDCVNQKCIGDDDVLLIDLDGLLSWLKDTELTTVGRGLKIRWINALSKILDQAEKEQP